MIKILSRPRAAGKTYESILESERTGAVIICASVNEARRIEVEARRMGKKIPQPQPCHEAYTRMQGRRCGVIVDNADWVLREFLGQDVSAVTFTGPPAEILWSEAAQPTTPAGVQETQLSKE